MTAPLSTPRPGGGFYCRWFNIETSVMPLSNNNESDLRKLIFLDSEIFICGQEAISNLRQLLIFDHTVLALTHTVSIEENMSMKLVVILWIVSCHTFTFLISLSFDVLFN